MTENEPFKNMIENECLQQRQMIETNASILKTTLVCLEKTKEQVI